MSQYDRLKTLGIEMPHQDTNFIPDDILIKFSQYGFPIASATTHQIIEWLIDRWKIEPKTTYYPNRSDDQKFAGYLINLALNNLNNLRRPAFIEFQRKYETPRTELKATRQEALVDAFRFALQYLDENTLTQ